MSKMMKNVFSLCLPKNRDMYLVIFLLLGKYVHQLEMICREQDSGSQG